MDNRLWEHEDIVVANLIVCLEYARRLRDTAGLSGW